jgi:hypothetical protein
VNDGSGWVTYVQSDGTMADFYTSGGDSYTSPAGPFAFTTLAYSDGQYTLTATAGIEERFNSSGLLTHVIDNDNNDTHYCYSGDLLHTITNPSHQTTTFGYTGGVVTSITDFDDRATDLAYSEDEPGGQLLGRKRRSARPSGTVTTAPSSTTGSILRPSFRPTTRSSRCTFRFDALAATPPGASRRRPTARR